jgi:hypothetical protein
LKKRTKKLLSVGVFAPAVVQALAAQRVESFLVLFFKKEPLAFFGVT